MTLPRVLLSKLGYYSEIKILECAMSALAEATPTTMPEPIVFTDSAAAKVADLIAEEGNTDLKLRVFDQGGGC